MNKPPLCLNLNLLEAYINKYSIIPFILKAKKGINYK